MERTKEGSGSAVLTSAIRRSLSAIDRETQEQMGRKFELCYVMAKESIPLAKYTGLLELKEYHMVDIGQAYRTPDFVKFFLQAS